MSLSVSKPSLLAGRWASAFEVPTAAVWYLPHSLVSRRCPPARGQTLLERHLSGELPTPFLE